MPEIMIVAGPNGAGKTSFASNYFADQPDLPYLNADEIARKLDITNTNHRDFRAGRLMLEQMEAQVEKRADFVFETTLASLSYRRKILNWQRLGYKVVLLYIKLPSPEHSITRVKHRVEGGGHYISETSIRRRFPRSLLYLESIYKPIVNEWYIFESLEKDFRLVTSWKDA